MQLSDQLRILHQRVFRRSQVGLVDLAFQDRGDTLFVGSLNTQEVGMTVQSIGTAVEVGNIAGDHLLVAAGKMALGEMYGVGKLHDLAQENQDGDPKHLMIPGTCCLPEPARQKS